MGQIKNIVIYNFELRAEASVTRHFNPVLIFMVYQPTPGSPFQPSLIVVGETWVYPFRCSTLGWAPGLTHKH
jgi:hypothetical protein